ncbi:hypothetical protein ABKV19_017443 [Rosa sericea]
MADHHGCIDLGGLFKVTAGYEKRRNIGFSVITCSSNGRGPDSVKNEVKSVEQLAQEKRRADLSARTASEEFTVNKSGIAACKSLGAFLIATDLQSSSLKSVEEMGFAAESQPKQLECPEECKEAIAPLMLAAARFSGLPKYIL